MRRGYIIVNRRARGLRDEASPLVAQCRAHATLQVFETNALAELDAVAARIADAPAPVVLAGGDGSHGAGITALARAFQAGGSGALPAIALAPGGTVNTVARGWGMRGSAVAYTRRLMESVVAGTAAVTLRPTLCVLPISDEKKVGLFDVAGSGALLVHAQDNERRTPGREREARSRGRLGFIFGAGLVSRFFEEYDAAGATGLASAAVITGRVFAGSFVGGELARHVLTPSPAELVVDGERAPFDRISLLCASVVADVGLGLRLLYRASESFARFHVVATPLGPRALGPQMTRVLRGLPLLGPRVDALAAELTLRFPDGTGSFVVDGELVRGEAVRVSAGPVIEVLEP